MAKKLQSDSDQGFNWRERLAQWLTRDGSRGDTISAKVGKGSSGVAIGKNIIQIGTFNFPFWWLLFILLVAVGAVVTTNVIHYLSLPTRMDGTFNVAIAEFGQGDNHGNGQPSSNGRLLSKYLYTDVSRYVNDLPPAVLSGFNIKIWQDDAGIQKRARIDVIPGNTPEARTKAACIKANEISANIIIYGNVPQDTSLPFSPEYAICDTKLKFDADQIVGSHNLGMSISGNTLVDLNDSQNRLTANIKITEMGNALSALTIGIMWDLQGYTARALAAFNDVKDRVRKIPGQKDNVVIYFFIGREYLMQKQYDQAKDNFTSAIGINPDYALAHIGLGGVYFARAALIPAEASQKADLQNAVNEYTLAINKAPTAPGDLVGPLARLALASTFILQGDIEQAGQDLAAAAADYNHAVDGVAPIILILKTNEQYRVLGMAYMYTGNAYFHLGNLKQIQGDKPASLPIFLSARDNYILCSDQGKKLSSDGYLNSEVIGKDCSPNKINVDEAIKSLGGA